MQDTVDRFSIDELCALADTPRRTVRFYIQQGLVDRPGGARRNAYYTREHLEQLLVIRKWQRAGLSLNRIRELLSNPEATESPVPEPRNRPGEVSVRSHIMIRRGVELVIDPREAGMTPEDVQSLVREAVALTRKPERE